MDWWKLLSNRKQQVVLNGHKSRTIPVTSGVPQGSVLSPLLFTMFVSEIPSIVSSPVLMFADDTKIFRVIRNRDDYIALQNDLELLQNSSGIWNLMFLIHTPSLWCNPPLWWLLSQWNTNWHHYNSWYCFWWPA